MVLVAFVTLGGFSLLYDSNSGQIVQPPPIQQAGIAAISNNDNTAGTNGRTGWFVVDGAAGTIPFPGGFGSGGLAVSDAFLLDDDGMHDLGALPGMTNSEAQAMNNHGDLVGQSSLGALNTAHAVLFSRGEIIDLNDLAPGTEGFVHRLAVGINDHGAIIGFSQGPNFTRRSFLLLPVD